MGFCWLAFPSQVKKGVSPHEVRRRFDDEAVATKVAVRWVVNGSVIWPLPNVEGIVNSCTWSVSWKLAVHMLPLFYIFLYNCNILYPYWPLWTTVFIFLTFTCHFWSSPRLRPMQVVELIRKVIPLKAGNFLERIGEYWFHDFMSQWAMWRKIQYFHAGKTIDERWLESPTNITVLTQGLKVFSPALWSANPLVYPFKSRASDFSCRDDCAPSERREIVGG